MYKLRQRVYCIIVMKIALAGIILYKLNLSTILFSFELDSVFNSP